MCVAIYQTSSSAWGALYNLIEQHSTLRVEVILSYCKKTMQRCPWPCNSDYM